jgi:hypothetical protein
VSKKILGRGSAGKHFSNAFFRGKDDGKPIGPAPLIKQALKIVFRIRFK